ncbi:hypothetical protein ACSIEO_004695, partial [Shigella flexneri]
TQATSHVSGAMPGLFIRTS